VRREDVLFFIRFIYDAAGMWIAGIPIAIGKVLVDAGRGSEDLCVAGTPVYDEERAGVSRGSFLL
jgi:hypothetical protein